jgi:hypothetical protein
MNYWASYNKKTGKLYKLNNKRKCVIPYSAKEYIGKRYCEFEYNGEIYIIIPLSLQTRLNPEVFDN